MLGFDALASTGDHCWHNPMEAVLGSIVSNCWESHSLWYTMSPLGRATGDTLTWSGCENKFAFFGFFFKLHDYWDFPGCPVVKTVPFNSGCASSIPGQGTKIPHASWPENQNIKQKQHCNQFSKDFENGPHPKKKKKNLKKLHDHCELFNWPDSPFLVGSWKVAHSEQVHIPHVLVESLLPGLPCLHPEFSSCPPI